MGMVLIAHHLLTLLLPPSAVFHRLPLAVPQQITQHSHPSPIFQPRIVATWRLFWTAALHPICPLTVCMGACSDPCNRSERFSGSIDRVWLKWAVSRTYLVDVLPLSALISCACHLPQPSRYPRLSLQIDSLIGRKFLPDSDHVS